MSWIPFAFAFTVNARWDKRDARGRFAKGSGSSTGKEPKKMDSKQGDVPASTERERVELLKEVDHSKPVHESWEIIGLLADSYQDTGEEEVAAWLRGISKEPSKSGYPQWPHKNSVERTLRNRKALLKAMQRVDKAAGVGDLVDKVFFPGMVLIPHYSEERQAPSYAFVQDSSYSAPRTPERAAPLVVERLIVDPNHPNAVVKMLDELKDEAFRLAPRRWDTRGPSDCPILVQRTNIPDPVLKVLGFVPTDDGSGHWIYQHNRR